MRRWHGLLLLTLALVACSTPPPPGFSLPNARLTPGVVLTTDAAVVCVSGYASTVRQSLTVQQRDQVDRAYGWTYRPGAQEMDHLIPLELGGANGTQNIWPQPITEAKVKDRLENDLHAKVCSGRMTLPAAQLCIKVNWVTCWAKENQP